MSRDSGVRILEWYRADAWPRMRRALVTGPLGLSVGGGVVAVSFLARAPETARVYAAGGGFAIIASSVLFTLVAMSRILREDAFVAIRTDGVFFRAEGRETLLSWEALARARWDDARAELLLFPALPPALPLGPGGSPEATADAPAAAPDPFVLTTTFAGIAGRALAERIEQARRRAAMGWLR